MYELIKVNYESDRPTVSARELHEFLEIETPFQIWFPRMTGYGFAEHTDYEGFVQKCSKPTGGRPSTDYQLTIDMAKELCMIQRNEKGKEARRYFLDIERKWNSPEQVMARALQMADSTILSLRSQNTGLTVENAQQKQIIAEMEPKASYYDKVLASPDPMLTSVIAKDYGKSAKWFNATLHALGIQYKLDGTWLLYQKYAEQGYTKSYTHTYEDRLGMTHTTITTCWTQKGRLFLYDLLRKHDILPVMERIDKKKSA